MSAHKHPFLLTREMGVSTNVIGWFRIHVTTMQFHWHTFYFMFQVEVNFWGRIYKILDIYIHAHEYHRLSIAYVSSPSWDLCVLTFRITGLEHEVRPIAWMSSFVVCEALYAGEVGGLTVLARGVVSLTATGWEDPEVVRTRARVVRYDCTSMKCTKHVVSFANGSVRDLFNKDVPQLG